MRVHEWSRRSALASVLGAAALIGAACAPAAAPAPTAAPAKPAAAPAAAKPAATTAPAAAAKPAAQPAAGKTLTIALSQFVTHPALDASREGAKKALEDAGFKEGPNVKYVYENAQGQIPTIATIAQRFRDQNVDLVVAVSTPVMQGMLNTFKGTNTPIVFNAVTDPYSAAQGVITSPTDKPENVTGVQALPPVKDAMQFAKTVVPSAKKFGIIWNPAEKNSEVATGIAREAAKELNLELVEATITTADEVTQAAQSLLVKGVDLFFISTDSTVVSAFEGLVKVANENKKPLFANDPASAVRGAAGAVGIDYYQQGYESGELAAKILKGTPTAQVPIEKAKKVEAAVNLEAAEKQGVKFPPEVLAQVKEENRFKTITPAKPKS